jgi:hypothetical protein
VRADLRGFLPNKIAITKHRLSSCLHLHGGRQRLSFLSTPPRH